MIKNILNQEIRFKHFIFYLICWKIGELLAQQGGNT